MYIIAEIGINHNGDLTIAKKLIDAAYIAGCDAVKFQKRTPELCVPDHQKNIKRETPWGEMTYLDYKKKIEFGYKEYKEIDEYCYGKIDWFASVWDVPSVKFMEQFNPKYHKIPSALITDMDLLDEVKNTGRQVIISTGMSTIDEISQAVYKLRPNVSVLHCNSTYPAKAEEINLKVIDTLRSKYKLPIGYSGHEVGLQITLAAAAFGAEYIERHITLDRTMWGTDQAASVEPHGLIKLVRDIRLIQKAIGDGAKKVYDSELPIRKKLRGE